MKPSVRNAALIAAGVAAGAAVTVALRPGPQRAVPAAAEAPAQQWHCAMHPTYVSVKPGDCPICGL
jgi:hypothetical protein